MLISASQTIYLPFYMELLKKRIENVKQMPHRAEIAQRPQVMREYCHVHGKQGWDLLVWA